MTPDTTNPTENWINRIKGCTTLETLQTTAEEISKEMSLLKAEEKFDSQGDLLKVMHAITSHPENPNRERWFYFDELLSTVGKMDTIGLHSIH